MPRTFVYLFLTSLIIFAGCSRSNKEMADSDGSVDSANAYAREDTASINAQEGQVRPRLPVVNRAHYHTVEIKQMMFQPQELTVMKGDTVVWVNNGITAHDVTQQPDAKWTSSSLPVGASWKMIANETTDYYCSIHVVMKGKLVVR